MVDNSWIRTYDLCIFIPLYPLVETFLLHLATPRNIKWQTVVKIGTAGSIVKLQPVLTNILQTFDIFIKKSSYFLTKFVNNIEKQNTADCEVSYIKFINSVWRGSLTFKMAEYLSLVCCSTVQVKRDVIRWRTGEAVKGKLANWVGSRYTSHYLEKCFDVELHLFSR
jgi:hypothetical protein